MYLAREPLNGKRPPSSAKLSVITMKSTPARTHESIEVGPIADAAPSVDSSQAEPIMPVIPNMNTSRSVRALLSLGPSSPASSPCAITDT